MDFVQKPFQKVITVFLLLLAIYIMKVNADFKETYADYIEGDSAMSGHDKHIMVKYQFIDVYGQEQDDYYIVPSLSLTPEWQLIQLLRLIFVFILPWAVPRPTKPIIFFPSKQAEQLKAA